MVRTAKDLVFERHVVFDDTEGDAYFNWDERVIIGDRAHPPVIGFRSGGGPMPRLTMRIEFRGHEPVCTSVQLESDNADNDVRFKHLKYVQIEQWITHIVDACSMTVARDPGGGLKLGHSGPSREGYKAVERLQRRRRNPNDRAVLEQVAAIYKAHPDAPVKTIMHELGMSRRTAGRWAARCSEEGLLPPADTKGKKRL
jgi:hypothetical protein